jgi:hypothetical protein
VRLRSWLRCLSLIAFVEYRASLASDFNSSYLDAFFWEIEAYIAASGYMGSASGFSCEEKSMDHRKLNACSYVLR